MRRPAAWLAVLLLLVLARPFSAAAGCDPKAPPDCSCGKLPVCVFSGHPDGMYSDLYAKSKDPAAWQGFGQGDSDYAMAMQIESDMAQALAAAYPCLDVITTDSYLASTMVVTQEGEDSGLLERMRQARAAGDAAALAQLTREADALFDKWGVGDLPWQDPELASAHMAGRLTGCLSTVKLSGKAEGGSYRVSATSAVPLGQALDDTTSSASGDTPQGGVAELAKTVAGPLAAAHQQLFGSCQETERSCVGVNWELAHQTHRCDFTQRCNGQVVRTWSEDGEGLRGVGLHIERETACCSPLAKARAGEGDPDDKALADQIWCPGTWNLWARDLDCDGVPNAEDETPWPPAHNP